MEFLHIILPVLTGALIGYCTNYIAIKMLFRPRKEKYIGKWRLPFTPGVIPKNKSRIASAVGNAINDKLLTESDIAGSVKSSGFIDESVKEIISYITADTASLNRILNKNNANNIMENVSEVLGDKILSAIRRLDMKTVIGEVAQKSFGNLFSNPMVGMLLGGNAMDSISEKIATSLNEYIDSNGKELIVPAVKQEMDGIFAKPIKENLESIHITENDIRTLLENTADKLINNSISKLISHIDVKRTVEGKINAMDEKELENLVMYVMKNELQAVINLGAVIGAVIGIVNIFI